MLDGADLTDVLGADVGDLVLLQAAQDCLDWVVLRALSFPTAPLTSASWRAQTLTACRETANSRATSACTSIEVEHFHATHSDH